MGPDSTCRKEQSRELPCHWETILDLLRTQFAGKTVKSVNRCSEEPRRDAVSGCCWQKVSHGPNLGPFFAAITSLADPRFETSPSEVDHKQLIQAVRAHILHRRQISP